MNIHEQSKGALKYANSAWVQVYIFMYLQQRAKVQNSMLFFANKTKENANEKTVTMARHSWRPLIAGTLLLQVTGVCIGSHLDRTPI